MEKLCSNGYFIMDEYGFLRTDADYDEYRMVMSSYLTVLARREQRWESFLREQSEIKKSRRLKRYIRKGIPLSYRGLVWLAVSGAQDLKNEASDDFYGDLLRKERNSAVVEAIIQDLHRTYPDNVLFEKEGRYQSGLFNVLIAYATHNPRVGYCQGLNYIVGMLLLITKSEVEAFWLLKVLVEHILKDYYSSSMEGVIVDIEVLSELIRIIDPAVYAHMSNLGLPWAIVATKWFVCLFAEVLPTETLLRVWDCLFSEGSKILFRVSITLIKHNRTELLACENFIDTVQCFKNITKNYFALNCHDFIKSIFEVPGKLSNSTIKKLRKRVLKKKRLHAKMR